MKITLLGYGIEGESAYRYFFAKYPDAEFTILDNAVEPKKTLPEGVVFQGNVQNFHDIDADIVVKTPAIPPSRVSTRGDIISVTREFFAQCSAPIIGVTGTKGKGTTCTLIARILEAAGKKVWLVGNIGVSGLDIVAQIEPNDIVVYEMSSFQLWDLDQSPQTAVVLLIEPDHLNVHKDFAEYVAAKGNITRYQHEDDIVIYHPTNTHSSEIAALSVGQKIRYQTSEGAYIESESIMIDGQKVGSITDVALPGVHNLENVCAAVTASWRYTHDIDAIEQAIQSFTGLPHHIEKIREVNGVSYYDDSYSSATPATIAAVKSFSQPVVLILGGLDRGVDIAPLVQELSILSNIKHVIAVGEVSESLVSALLQKKVNVTEVNGSMDAVIKTAQHEASPGDIVLLSPGFASFDQYANFIDRGEKFQEEVSKL